MARVMIKKEIVKLGQKLARNDDTGYRLNNKANDVPVTPLCFLFVDKDGNIYVDVFNKSV